jgi:ubiquinone biosynthesis protein COQ4
MSAAPAIDTRLHPVTAFRAVRRLMGNPGDTTQVFVILRAMRGTSAARAYRRFRDSPTGVRILAERRDLLEALGDTRLAPLPEGTLGYAYRGFMRAENLSAMGLIEAAESVDDEGWPPEAERLRARMRVMHDLTHVVTGYGRDPFGELCLLAFMQAQMRHLSMAMIVGMGLLRVLRERQRGPALAAVLEAWRHGRRAHWLAGEDWESLLLQPLDSVRRTLRIAPPAHYAALVAHLPKDRL